MHVPMNVKLSYMFRRLLRHLQGEIFCMLKTVVTFGDYTSLSANFVILFCCNSFEQFVFSVLIVAG